MAEIRTFPLINHLRSEPTCYTLQYRSGRLAREGKGLAFWFRPLSSSVVEVPLDDQEHHFLAHAKSLDFQDLAVQGVVTYRVKDPKMAAERIDFTIRLEDGKHVKTPLEQLSGLFGQLAQQIVLDYTAQKELRELLTAGVSPLRDLIWSGLAGENRLQDLGIEIVAARVSALKPSSEMEKALSTPTRESIQEKADKAMFARRAEAVKEERTIEENELQNRIELAKKQELLVAQEGQNNRLQAQEKAAAERIVLESVIEEEALRTSSEAENLAVKTQAEVAKQKAFGESEAERIKMIESARVEAEKAHNDIYKDLEPKVLMALAAQDLAKKLHTIEHLNITPDMLNALMQQLKEN